MNVSQLKGHSSVPLSILYCLILLFPGMSHAETAPNQLTEAEKRSGWELLFDGKSMDAWRNYKQDNVSDGWKVEDGAIVRFGKKAGDIITREKFEHFELSLEYRISEKGNSGLMFHVTEDEKRPYHTGPEIQIQDNDRGKDPQKSGWLYQLYKPTNPGWQLKYEAAMKKSAPDVLDATRPPGEWNHMYVRVANRGEVVMNGWHYFYFQKGSDDWNKRVANSKFKRWEAFGKATEGHICLQDHGNLVSFRNIKIRRISANGYDKQPIDGTLSVKAVPAFPKLKWEGWESAEETGKYRPTRPMTMAHAKDGSNRMFVAMQSGTVHAVVNDAKTEKSQLVLDLRDKVMDWNNGFVENEEGLLGMALHPNFKENGYLYVNYNPRKLPRRTIVSRFTVSKDSHKADPKSEVVLIDAVQPFPNHNGGSVEFGPDGYLYIGFGDGGLRNDYLNFAQDLTSMHGSILRIDVDRSEDGKPYAIPKDNPFVGRDDALPETYAYGFRNIWRMSFDRKTGDLWAADVGQDLIEEINLVKKGGNYGWSIREGTNPFGNRDVKIISPPIDPIWEYDHQLGKSITGGFVYRGKAIPELEGYYVYADFVSSKVWALKYDRDSKKVVKNMLLPIGNVQVMAFGEDQHGELYYSVQSPNGQSIFRLE